MTNMREKARIKRILKLLETYWLKHPDLRLGQLIMNMTWWGDTYETEDNITESNLREALLQEKK